MTVDMENNVQKNHPYVVVRREKSNSDNIIMFRGGPTLTKGDVVIRQLATRKMIYRDPLQALLEH